MSNNITGWGQSNVTVSWTTFDKPSHIQSVSCLRFNSNITVSKTFTNCKLSDLKITKLGCGIFSEMTLSCFNNLRRHSKCHDNNKCICFKVLRPFCKKLNSRCINSMRRECSEKPQFLMIDTCRVYWQEYWDYRLTCSVHVSTHESNSPGARARAGLSLSPWWRL